MRRWIWMLLTCGACRQVFGIPEVPPLSPDGRPAPQDGSNPFPDASSATMPGLRMHVLGGAALWTNPSTAWTATANHPSAIETVWVGTGPDVGDLAFSGVDPSGVFSVWMEGEVYVDSAQQVQLAARDYAFLSADVFGMGSGGAYIDVASSVGGMVDTETVPVPGPKWYPVRLGWTSSAGNPSLTILHQGADDTGLIRFNSANLRH